MINKHVKPSVISAANKSVLRWFSITGRSLPWRLTRNPYEILVSEVMLQQTQVARVVPFYLKFLEQFPTFESLANASLADVIRSWSGLGYNRRAINLHRIAQIVTQSLEGKLPANLNALMELKGIGSYTASAICCFAFGCDVPVFDTNSKRVLTRLIFGTEVPNSKELISVGREMIPENASWEWNQGLMDLGAMVCLPNQPKCPVCPIRKICRASNEWLSVASMLSMKQQSRQSLSKPFRGSRRFFRGRILAILITLKDQEAMLISELTKQLNGDYPGEIYTWLLELLSELSNEGLIAFSDGGDSVSLPIHQYDS